MTRRTVTVVVRTSAIERCVTGVLLLGRADAITGLIAGDQSRPPAWLVRVLGVRLLAQGLLEYTYPRRMVVLAGAAVDAAHAASMVMAAIIRPAYRRTAAVSAAEATVSAVVGGALTRRLPGDLLRLRIPASLQCHDVIDGPASLRVGRPHAN